MSDYHHVPANYKHTFRISIALNTIFVVLEVVYGFLSNSLSLLADAGHNTSNVLGLFLVWGASIFSRRQLKSHQIAIFAPLFNAMFLLMTAGAIAWAAIQRLQVPSRVASDAVIAIAIVGIVINAVTALILLLGQHKKINLHAFLYIAVKTLVPLGVLLAGIAMFTTKWLWFDSVISLMIVVVIVVKAWQLLLKLVNLTADTFPAAIDSLAVNTYLAQLPGVTEINDLRIWGTSTTEIALTAHLIMPSGFPGDAFLARVMQELQDRFGIDHTTLQIETGESEYSGALVAQQTF